MTTTNTQSTTEAPERIWIDNGSGIWQTSGRWKLDCPNENFVVEYVRADLASPASAAPVVDNRHPEDFCQKCKRPNVVWFAPSPLWNAAVRAANEPEILCPVCFIQLAEAIGVSTAWFVAPEGYKLPAAATAVERGADTNFPLSETLRLLVEWAQHLHDSHECDCDGWEQRSFPY